MNLQDYQKDLDAISSMPESEVKFIRTSSIEATVMDVKTYRMSMERDGGKTWEKLKKMRAIFNKT